MSYPPPYGPPPYPPPRPGVLPLAPLDLGDVLGGVFKTWVASWRLVLAVSVALAVATALIGLPFSREMSQISALPQGPPQRTFDAITPHLVVMALLVPLNVVASAVLNGVATGLFALIGRQEVLGRHPTWTQIWQQVRPVLGRLVGLSLVVYLVAGLGLLFCIVPGIIIYTLWALAIPALVTERLTVGQALRRSYRLVLGDGWRVFAILALVVVVLVAVGFALSAPLGGGVQFSMDPGFTETGWGFLAASTAAGLPAGIVTAAVLPLTTLMLYVDQRIRRERYDVQLAQEAWGPPDGR